MVDSHFHVIEDSDTQQSACQDDCDSPPVQHVLIADSEASVRPMSPLTTVVVVPEDTATAEPQAESVVDENIMIKLNDQQGFLLFVKIYSLYISRTNDARKLARKFKATVTRCTLENRRGNPDYMPLQEVVQKNLRVELGEVHWTKAQHILRVYCHQHGIQLDSSPHF